MSDDGIDDEGWSGSRAVLVIVAAMVLLAAIGIVTALVIGGSGAAPAHPRGAIR